MDQDELLKTVRTDLEKLSDGLAELQAAAEVYDADAEWWTGNNHANFTPNKKCLAEAKEYWRIGRVYSDLTKRYLAGQREGWVEPLQKALADLALLKPKFAALTPAQLPPSPATILESSVVNYARRARNT